MEELTLSTSRVDEPVRLDEPDLNPAHVRPVDVPAVWKAIFDDLRGKLLSGVWVTEGRIPSERRLAEDYNVARPTIREALRALQVEGLIEIRRSKAGGAMVNWPARRSEEDLRTRLERKLPELLEIIDSRMAVEEIAARWAAGRHASEHLKTMDESVQELKKVSKRLDELKEDADANSSPKAERNIEEEEQKERLKFQAADTKFHLAVAVAASNRHLLDAITRLRTEFFLTEAVDLLSRDGKAREKIEKDHEDILKKIKSGEKDEAAEAMREHIKDIKRELVSKLLKDHELEKQIAVKETKEEFKEDPKIRWKTTADIAREKLRGTKVFAIGQPESENAEAITKQSDILSYTIDGGSEIKIPVFTRYDFMQAAYDRYPAWRELPVTEVGGEALLSELKPISDKLKPRKLQVAINPWTPPLKFELPVPTEESESAN